MKSGRQRNNFERFRERKGGDRESVRECVCVREREREREREKERERERERERDRERERERHQNGQYFFCTKNFRT
jgi:colicin import membrane protein